MNDYRQYVQRELTRLKQENARLEAEAETLRQYVDSMHLLVNATFEMDPTEGVYPLLDKLLYNAMLMLNAQDGSLLVMDEETNELVFVITHGSAGSRGLQGHRMPAHKGVAGWVIQNNQAVIVNDAYGDDRFYKGIDSTFSHVTRSILAAPISTGDEVLGVLEVLNKHDGMPFNEADKSLLRLLCRFAAQVLHDMLDEEPAGESPPTGPPTPTPTEKAS